MGPVCNQLVRGSIPLAGTKIQVLIRVLRSPCCSWAFQDDGRQVHLFEEGAVPVTLEDALVSRLAKRGPVVAYNRLSISLQRTLAVVFDAERQPRRSLGWTRYREYYRDAVEHALWFLGADESVRRILRGQS